ncbi:MAG TPA: hypothetical protein VGB91_13740 [Rhizomicrobium sp.]
MDDKTSNGDGEASSDRAKQAAVLKPWRAPTLSVLDAAQSENGVNSNPETGGVFS